MNCIVTGGAGFIGSHLCEKLVKDGHQVLCVDNFITGSKSNVSHLINNPRFELLEKDCSYPIKTDFKPEIIFHLASPASPPKYQHYAIETILVNTQGTYHLLEIARESKAIFVFASTSEIYGDPLEHPQKESYWGNVNPIGPRACYDESKRAGETITSTFAKKHGLDFRIIRIFNTYGPRMDIDDGRVVTNFIKQILSGSPLVIHGDGTQTRSFCYISDLVEGLMSIGFNSKAQNEVFNLGNPQELNMKELANLLCQITNYSPKFEYGPLPLDDPKRRKPDITKIKNLLGWEPKVTLEQGLKLTLAYFQQKSS